MARTSLVRRLVPALPFLAVVAACNCDPPGTQATSGDLRVDRTSLVFGEICNGAIAVQTFTAFNDGNGDLGIVVALSGADLQFFTVEPVEATLTAGGGSQVITVTYHPSGADQLDKHHFAQVNITSNATDGNASADITIDGETSAQAPQPILSLGCGAGVPTCREAAPGEACCTPIELGEDGVQHGRSTLGTLNFGDTPRGSTATLPLTVTNLGCADLTVSDVQLVAPGSGVGYCAEESVSLVTAMPVTVRGGTDPNARETAEVEVRFAPTDLCTYTGRMTFVSNDPDVVAGTNTEGWGQANLLGSGTEARITTNQNCLVFGDIAIGTTVTETVHVSNVGTQDIDVSQMRIRGGNTDFQIVSAVRKVPDCAAADEALTTPYTLERSNAAPCGPDEADVTVSYTPTEPAGQDADDLEIVYAGGTALVCLRGGSEPEIEVIPDGDTGNLEFRSPSLINGCLNSCDDTECTHNCVDEQDCPNAEPCIDGICVSQPACLDTCTAADKTFQVCNRGRAPLHIEAPNGILLTGPQGGEVPVHSDPDRQGLPMFELRDDTCSGAALATDTCCTASVHFSDSRNGGFKNAELHIFSDDPSYPRTADETLGGYILAVRAITDTDVDPVPAFVSRPDGDPAGDCNGASFCRVGEWVVLDASPSTDDSGPIQDFAWEYVDHTGASDFVPGVIDPANPDAICGGVNGGDCIEFTGVPVGRQIKFFPDVAGQYCFRLRVSDGICNPPHEAETVSGVQIAN